eukprot:TRINITY_DN2262_c0_g1_i2.p2 TRINITY_DN2262_c0_g1~~TRINITY_DN2262_c0_g1_i2.p2  ORF type:complete len:329 (+),score=85.40 TRINITY_DN2262_c0_g1_i2:1327-2313(+)
MGSKPPSQDDYTLVERLLKEAWANNGDVLSKQYAGTGALKADFTRTGKQRKIGVMKDGVNSLSRYFINNFVDDMRQASIDLFLGRPVETIDLTSVQKRSEDPEERDLQEHRLRHAAALLMSRFLHDETIVQAWPINAVNKLNKEKPRVLVLTDRNLYRAKYNDKEDKLDRTKRISLDTLTSVAKGTTPFPSLQIYFSSSSGSSAIGSRRKEKAASKRYSSSTYEDDDLPEGTSGSHIKEKRKMNYYKAPEHYPFDSAVELVDEIISSITEARSTLLKKPLDIVEEKAPFRRSAAVLSPSAVKHRSQKPKEPKEGHRSNFDPSDPWSAW